MHFLRTWFVSLTAIALLCLTVTEAASDTFDAKGVMIHYVIEGKGEPVVLIHGLLSSASINWKLPGVIAELAKDHKVIALDLPGHGQSGKPADREAYGVQMVDDIILLLDHLKIKKAHVVGYSLGGMVAMTLMARHPQRVLSGTVCGMGWFREGSGLQKLWKKLPGGRLGPPSAFFEAVGTLALTEAEVKEIDPPVKILVGDRDIVKRLYVMPLRKVRTDWPVVEIEDADHFSCILRPQFREEIAAWVRKNSK
jgi:pimeloyl-ACP methyl ester carboxylesterase